jgi:hypothetical protein
MSRASELADAIDAGVPYDEGEIVEELRRLDRVNAELVERMQAFADRQYCLGIEMLQRQECLGWEAKVKAGRFGQAHPHAHVQAGRYFGAHFGIYEAIKTARAALTSATKEQKK